MSPFDTFMFDWFGDTLFNVVLFNLVLVGPASFATGHAVAMTWRHWGADGLLHRASFGRSALSRLCAGRRRAVVGGRASCWAGRSRWRSAAFAYRLTRVRQMVRQYPWLYRRKGLLGWEERH